MTERLQTCSLRETEWINTKAFSVSDFLEKQQIFLFCFYPALENFPDIKQLMSSVQLISLWMEVSSSEEKDKHNYVSSA